MLGAGGDGMQSYGSSSTFHPYHIIQLTDSCLAYLVEFVYLLGSQGLKDLLGSRSVPPNTVFGLVTLSRHA